MIDKSFSTTRFVYEEATRIVEAINATIKNLPWICLYISMRSLNEASQQMKRERYKQTEAYF